MPKYYLQSENTDTVIKTFDTFDRKAVREAICDHLKTNPTDCIKYLKEAAEDDLKHQYDDLIDYYVISPYSGKPSKVIEGTTYPFKRKYISILKKKTDD